MSFNMQEKVSASLVAAYAALRPRDGFSHPHQEHMKDTFIMVGWQWLYYGRMSVSVYW